MGCRSSRGRSRSSEMIIVTPTYIITSRSQLAVSQPIQMSRMMEHSQMRNNEVLVWKCNKLRWIIRRETIYIVWVKIRYDTMRVKCLECTYILVLSNVEENSESRLTYITSSSMLRIAFVFTSTATLTVATPPTTPESAIKSGTKRSLDSIRHA